MTGTVGAAASAARPRSPDREQRWTPDPWRRSPPAAPVTGMEHETTDPQLIPAPAARHRDDPALTAEGVSDTPRVDDRPGVPAPPRLGVFSPEPIRNVRARHAHEGPRQWLVEGVWIEGTPAILGAEEKSGKTLKMLDLAVSIASGTPWLGFLPVPHPGPVLAICGEDDDREALRRIDAICAARNLPADDLPIRLSTCLPNLSKPESLQQLARELRIHPAKAVLLDPLYLAIGERGDGTSLYAMGAVLQEFGALCREAGASPLVLHHWNKSGSGRGRSRLAGTGTTQWARTILSMAVESEHEDHVTAEVEGREVAQTRTTTALVIEVSGNSVPSSTVRVERLMWADDPADLNSPLHYEILPGQRHTKARATEQPPQTVTVKERVLRAIDALPGWVAKSEVQTWDAQNPPPATGTPGELISPMKLDTVYRALRDLATEEVLTSRTRVGSREGEFSRPQGDDTPTPELEIVPAETP